MKYYLAGPMSGIPQFNFPAFHEAARLLRKQGYQIISPAELDAPEVQQAAMASTDGKLQGPNNEVAGHTWGQILAKDVLLVADQIDGIVFMPGWEKSRGVNLETTVGLLVNTRRFVYFRWHPDTETLAQASPVSIASELCRVMMERAHAQAEFNRRAA